MREKKMHEYHKKNLTPEHDARDGGDHGFNGDSPLTTSNEHPESVCEHCKRPNVTWFAPSALWNRFARRDGFDPMLCPVCFIKQAESQGFIPTAWRVAPERISKFPKCSACGFEKSAAIHSLALTGPRKGLPYGHAFKG